MFKNKLIFIIVFGFPLLLVSTIEYLNIGSIKGLIELAFKSKFFILEYILIFLILNSLLFFNKYLYIIFGVTTTSFLLLISIINKVKFDVRGEPVYPWDILLIKEAFGILETENDIIPITSISLFISTLVLTLVCYFLIFKLYDKLNKNIIKKFSLMSFGMLVTSLFLVAGTFKNNTIKEPVYTYMDTGIVYGIYQNAKYYIGNYKSLSNYNQVSINNIINSIEEPNNSKQMTDRPNVIVVMSEAFWDTNKLEEVTLNKDPLEFFRKIQQQSTSGELVVPVYGGATANTEFEVLTGLSTKFLAPGIIPYTAHLDEPIESLASIYRDSGYQSTAIHSYHNWFYDRNAVYKNLGFNKFISMEFFGDSNQIGAFIDDHDLFDILIEEVKQSEKPSFIYAVTMLNHGGYPENRFSEYTYEVNSGISDESKSILKTYVETQSIVDKSIEYLISELEEINEPTILVYFGDHLPMLGEDYKVYEEVNYYSKNENNYEEHIKMYSVPFIIWDNYGNQNKEELTISSNFLGNYILDYSGVKGNNLFNYHSELLKEGINIIPDKKYYEDANITTKKQLESIQNYELLQFDTMFGSNYSSNIENVIDSNYFLGEGKMEITGSYPSEIIKNELFNEYNNESIIGIIGENFVAVSPYFSGGSEIYINGEKQVTVFTDENYISCVVPKKYYRESGIIEIQVKVLDSKDKILSESNIIEVKVN